jgi:Tfp pilus assembly protein PilF
MESLKTAMDIFGEKSNHFYLAGRFGEIINQPKVSIDQYQKSVKKDPKNSRAWMALAMVLDRTGKEAEALTCCEKALQIAPWKPVFLNNYAVFLYHQSRLPEAEKAIARALQVYQNHLTKRDLPLRKSVLLNNQAVIFQKTASDLAKIAMQQSVEKFQESPHKGGLKAELFIKNLDSLHQGTMETILLDEF